MNTLLLEHATLLTKAFDDYNSDEFKKQFVKEVYDRYQKEIDAAGGCERFFADEQNLLSIMNIRSQYLPLMPVFERQGGQVILKSKFFEIDRFTIAVSTFIRGVDQFVAAEKIVESKQHQFIVFAYYSSIFQLLTSFLSLHGIVYIPKSHEGLKLQKLKTEEKNGQIRELCEITGIGFEKFVKGVYNDGQWKFSNIGNDHATRWKEYCDLLKRYLRNNLDNQIPHYVKRFWAYIAAQNEYTQTRWKEEKTKFEFEFRNKEDFINALQRYPAYPAKIRHQKIYENRHFDVFAWSYLLTNQNLPAEMETCEMSFFRDCAKDMLLWQYRNLKDLFEHVCLSCKDKRNFYRGMNTIADTPEMKMLGYLKDSLYTENILSKLGKNVPEFIKMLFS
jgi:hypothetical protein